MGKLYAGFGYDSISNYFNKDLWCYDPISGIWQQKNSKPGHGIREPSVAVVDSYAYIIGGHYFPDTINEQSSNQIWRYNVMQDKWDSMPPMPVSCASSAVYSFKHFILMAFGEYESSATSTYNQILTGIYKLDLDSMLWSPVSYTGTVMPSGFGAYFQYGTNSTLTK
jgi:N-acetylneuraminic acid mutarotase